MEKRTCEYYSVRMCPPLKLLDICLYDSSSFRGSIRDTKPKISLDQWQFLCSGQLKLSDIGERLPTSSSRQASSVHDFLPQLTSSK